MAMSLVASTGGVTLLPLYAENLLSPSVVARPLQGEVPTIDLVAGYNRSNTSPLLKRFLSRVDEMVARVSQGTPAEKFLSLAHRVRRANPLRRNM